MRKGLAYQFTEYSAEFPVLHSRSLLVIHFKYSSVYMSILNSQYIPPFRSPETNTTLLINYTPI